MTYEENGVTCRRKLMCTEGGGRDECSKQNAKCVEDTSSKNGYKCECNNGQEMDDNGVCKRKCDLQKYQKLCIEKKAYCEEGFIDGENYTCKCLPLLTFGEDGKCTEIAKASYSGNLPLDSKKYIIVSQLSPSSYLSTDPASTIDYDLIRKDLRDSIRLLYGINYKFADVLSCNNTDDNLNCNIELQFESNPKNQLKLMTDAQSCLSDGSDSCFIPPRLLLKKKDLKPDNFAPTNPCQKEVKDANCGPLTRCSRIEENNYECPCRDGFESYGFYQPLSDTRTVIHRCQDINECLLPIACPNRTRCYNTIGSYDCMCLTGFKPLSATSDPKTSNCVEICSGNTCKYGKCEVTGDAYRCRCNEGYDGFNCEEALPPTVGITGMKIALITLSLLVVPLILVALFSVHKYRQLKAKTYQSSYLDDNSSQIRLQPLRRN